jgi:hypothetical protein
MRWRKTRSTGAAAGISLTMITLVALGTSCSSSAQTSANVQAAPQPLMMQMAHGAIERGEKGIKGSLEDDEKVTQNYWLTLGWGDDLPDSAVWEGTYGDDNVRIRLVPATTSPLVTWSKGLSSNPAEYSGHLVLKIIVLEDRDVKELGLKGLETGYLWIGQRGKGNSSGQGAAIYTLKNNGKAQRTNAKLEIAGYCKEDHGNRPMAKVRPDTDCTNPLPPPGSTGASAATVAHPFHTRAGPAPLFGQGLWVTCTGGCCEVKATQT